MKGSHIRFSDARIELGFGDITKNIRKNKKGMLLIFLGILLGGAIWGYIDYRTFDQKPYAVEDTIVQKVNLEHLKRDETYYYMAFMELKEKSCGLNAYIQYLKQVNLRGESMKKVSELEAAAMEERRKFEEIQEFYISEKAMIYDDPKAAEQFVIQKREMARLRQDKAKKRLEELGKKAEEKDRNLKIYAEQETEFWVESLAKMKDLDPAEAQRANSEMDLLLEEEMKNINALADKFNDLIADIEAEEQYEVIYNPYLLREYCDMAGIVGEIYYEDAVNVNKHKALIYARSIVGVDSCEERFYAILTFSIMLGVAFSVLYGSICFNKA